MLKNRIHKLADGRERYSVTDVIGQRCVITSRVSESPADFRERCYHLDLRASGKISSYTLDTLFWMWVEDKWPDTVKKLKRNIDKSASDYRNTKDAYVNHVQPVLGNLEVNDLRRYHVYDLLKQLQAKGYSNSMLSKIKGAISRPLDWAIDIHKIDMVNVCQGLRLPRKTASKPKAEISFFTEEDESRFFKAAETSRWRYYFKFLLLTGFRPSEALGLKWADVNDKEIVLSRSISRWGEGQLKNKSAYRTFPIGDTLKNILDAQKEDYPHRTWIFAGNLNVLTLDTATSAFKRIKARTAVWEKVGRKYHGNLIRPPIERTMYDFRHTFGTRMAEAGVSDYVLCSLMGHSDISVTKKYYIGITDDLVSSTVEIMDSIF